MAGNKPTAVDSPKRGLPTAAKTTLKPKREIQYQESVKPGVKKA